MTTIEDRPMGFILLSVAGVLTIIGAILLYSTVQLWRAQSRLVDYHLALLMRDYDRSRTDADAASALEPSIAACVLASIDITKTDSQDRLTRLLNQVPARDKPLVQTAMAWNAVMAGQGGGGDTDDTNGGDAIVLAALASLVKGTLPAPLDPDKLHDDPPHDALLDTCMQRWVQVAWQQKDRVALNTQTGLLLLLNPNLPQTHQLQLIAACLDPSTIVPTLNRLAQSVGKNQEDRYGFLRQLAVLVPERAGDLLGLIPPQARSAPEQVSVLFQGNLGLAEMLNIAHKQPTADVLVEVTRRCLEFGRYDLVNEMAALAPATIKPRLEGVAALVTGQLAKVMTAHGPLADLRPMALGLVRKPGVVAFHFATAAGVLPRLIGLDGTWDGQPVSMAGNYVLNGDIVTITIPQLRAPPPRSSVPGVTDAAAAADATAMAAAVAGRAQSGTRGPRPIIHDGRFIVRIAGHILLNLPTTP